MPIPLVLTARIRISQKIMLCALFSSGIFVMVAAFLRAYYSVKNISTLAIALGWASREALVSVFTVSAPGVKPLITQSKWFRSSRGGTSGVWLLLLERECATPRIRAWVAQWRWTTKRHAWVVVVIVCGEEAAGEWEWAEAGLVDGGYGL